MLEGGELSAVVIHGHGARKVQYAWDDHAYGSIVWLIIGFHSTHVISLVLKTIVMLTLSFRGERGRQLVRTYGCHSCHTIPGVRGADALVGPPLTRIGARVYVPGHLSNTPENLMRWIQDPPAVSPDTAMPATGVTDGHVRDIAAYLYTLK